MKNKDIYLNYLNYFVFILLFLIGFTVNCSNNYYEADILKIASFGEYDNVKKEILSDGSLVYYSDSIDLKTGLIFYPGARVDNLAYETLMVECANHGFLCIVADMPFSLAILDQNKADEIREKFDYIDNWYIGGHSLGGAMAASYLKTNYDKYLGLILLGSYSSVDLSNTSLKVLSIYGSNDKVLNLDKYSDYRNNLPVGYVEHVIMGGNHAYFGVYGEQDGDGVAFIENDEQINITINLIASLMESI